MSKRTPLTARQHEILKFITDYIADKGYPPSIRDMVRSFGWCGTNAAHCHLEALVKKGYLERDPMVARGMRVL